MIREPGTRDFVVRNRSDVTLAGPFTEQRPAEQAARRLSRELKDKVDVWRRNPEKGVITALATANSGKLTRPKPMTIPGA